MLLFLAWLVGAVLGRATTISYDLDIATPMMCAGAGAGQSWSGSQGCASMAVELNAGQTSQQLTMRSFNFKVAFLLLLFITFFSFGFLCPVRVCRVASAFLSQRSHAARMTYVHLEGMFAMPGNNDDLAALVIQEFRIVQENKQGMPRGVPFVVCPN